MLAVRVLSGCITKTALGAAARLARFQKAGYRVERIYHVTQRGHPNA